MSQLDDTPCLEGVADGQAARKSSFYWAMRMMPAERRQAMYRLYGFCRAVDDIADGPLAPLDKRARLQSWRDDVAALAENRGAATSTTTDAEALLAPLLARYPVEIADLLAIIDGCIMDVDEPAHAPEADRLMTYCDRSPARSAAPACRSLASIATRAARSRTPLAGRCNSPTSSATCVRTPRAGGSICRATCSTRPESTPPCLHPQSLTIRRYRLAAHLLAQEAEAAYLQALALMPRDAKARLRPALVMLGVYRSLLARMTADGFDTSRRPSRLARVEMLWVALRHGLPGLWGR